MAHASCELDQSNSFRPSEGLLSIGVHIDNQIANNSGNSCSYDLIHVNRILEKLLNESKAIELESLCISMDEKVWNIRIEIYILENDGCFMDCASIASLLSLDYLEIPKLEKVRNSVVINHSPLLVTYAVFDNM